MAVYFSVIVIPNKSISNEISKLLNGLTTKYKVHIPARYKKVPLHISLLFQNDKIAIGDAGKFIKHLKAECKSFNSFKVRINGFGYFAKPGNPPKYSVYVSVVNNTDLRWLYLMVISKIPNSYSKPTYSFVPHISLIRGGLTEEKFMAIKKECNSIEFKRSFIVKGIYIGTQKNDGGKWVFSILKFHS